MIAKSLIALFVLAPCALSGQVPKRLTACEVVRQGRKLDEQIISFAGTVELADPGTPDERIDDVLLTCGNKKMKIKIRDAETRFLSNPPAGFRLDTASLVKVYRMLEDASKRGHVVTRFQATVEAWIRNQPEPQNAPPGN